MASFTYKETNSVHENEQLMVNLNKHNVKGNVSALKFIDKDTQLYVIYLQSLELSGYGSTVEQAEEMLSFLVDDYFNHLFTLSPAAIDTEFADLGWDKGRHKEEFSKDWLDITSELKTLNALDNKVERVTLIAA